MTIKDDIRLIDVGEANPLVVQRLRKFLLSNGPFGTELYDAVSVYLDEVPVVDWQVADKFVRYPEDPMVAAAAIAAGALRRCPSKAFWKAVVDIASGELWDSGNHARIQAILSLNRSPSGCDEKAKSILRDALSDRSAAVRDSAAIAAQRCYGIPENKVVAGGIAGNLLAALPDDVLQWLGLGSDKQL